VPWCHGIAGKRCGVQRPSTCSCTLLLLSSHLLARRIPGPAITQPDRLKAIYFLSGTIHTCFIRIAYHIKYIFCGLREH
jgi:hypothetical protein